MWRTIAFNEWTLVGASMVTATIILIAALSAFDFAGHYSSP
jgi:hypothetical protein